MEKICSTLKRLTLFLKVESGDKKQTKRGLISQISIVFGMICLVFLAISVQDEIIGSGSWLLTVMIHDRYLVDQPSKPGEPYQAPYIAYLYDPYVHRKTLPSSDPDPTQFLNYSCVATFLSQDVLITALSCLDERTRESETGDVPFFGRNRSSSSPFDIKVLSFFP